MKDLSLKAFLFRATPVAALVLLAACGGGGGSDAPAAPAPVPNPPPPPPPADFTIDLSEDKAVVMQGGTRTVTATVTRLNGFTGAVTIQLGDLPAGVGAAPVIIDAASNSAIVTLNAEGTAPHSLPTNSTVVGSSGQRSVNKPLTVTVRGAAGTVDTSFGGGKVVTPIGNAEDYVSTMAVQADGKVIVVGNTTGPQGTNIGIVRYQRDGAIDTTFGNGGKVVTSIGARTEMANAVAIQADGKIVVGGQTDVGVPPAGSDYDFALVRYNTDGSLDNTFGNGGIVVTSFGGDADRITAIQIQADGRIVVGGDTTAAATGVDFALARYHANGTLDATFGNGGRVITAIRSGQSRDSIASLAFQTVGGAGRIVAVGGEGDFVVARYRLDGSLDNTFGNGGTISGLFNATIGAARALAFTTDNRIVVAGHIGHDFALVRLNEAGTLDATFGTAGRVITPVATANWDEATSLVQQSDGRLIVGGWSWAGNSSAGDFAVVRYNADGSLDNRFGNNGIVITPVAPTTKGDSGRALMLQADERVPTVRVLQAGEANDANNDFALLRYWL